MSNAPTISIASLRPFCVRCRSAVNGYAVATWDKLPNHVRKSPDDTLFTPKGVYYCADCAAEGVAMCRNCGCTDEAGCVQIGFDRHILGTCSWKEADLCSYCYAALSLRATMVGKGRMH